MARLSTLIAPALLAVWGALVLINFAVATPYPYGDPARWSSWFSPFAWEPPPTWSAAGLVAAWTDALLAAGAAGLLLIAASGWGGWLGVWARLPLPGWSRAALGLGAVGTVLLGTGLAGVLTPAVVAGTLATGLAWWADPRRMSAPASPHLGGALGVVAAVAAAGWAFAALNPDAGVDAYVYHLRLPRYYLLRHRVFSVWHQDHAHVPQLWELLFTVFPPRLAAPGAQALSAFSAYAAFRTALSGSRGPAAAAALLLLFTSPLLVGSGTIAHTDLPMVWMAAAAWGALAAGPRRANRLAAGLFTGMACAVKYAAFPVLVAAAAWVVSDAVRGRRAGAGGAFAGWAAALSPWLVWNVLATGNPVYPFLHRLAPWALDPPVYAANVSAAVFRRSPGEVLRSVWNAYVRSAPFLFVSPAFLALVPALLWRRFRGEWASGTGWWLAAGWAAWSATLADERFALPFASAAGIAAASAVRPGRAAAAAFALLLAVNTWGCVRTVCEPAGRAWTALGLAGREAWWRRTLSPAPGYWDAARWVSVHARPADRVLLVADYKSHGYDREVIHEHVVDSPARLLTILRGAPPDPARIAARFRQLGVRWVVYLPSRAAERLRTFPDFFPFDPPRAKAYYAYWVRHARVAATPADAIVFELRTRGGAAAEVPGLPGLDQLATAAVAEAWRSGGWEAAAEQARRLTAVYPLVAAFRGLPAAAYPQ